MVCESREVQAGWEWTRYPLDPQWEMTSTQFIGLSLESWNYMELQIIELCHIVSKIFEQHEIAGM